MADMQKIADYLGECGVFYFGTVVGNAPVIRPLGFKMVRNGQLYFGIGTHKDAYKQLVANPNVYICAMKPDGQSWIRISGKAVCDTDPALVDAAFSDAPELKPMYDANGWEMGVFHLEDGEVTYVEHVMTPASTETF